jgi:hypothetical protein
LDSGDVIHPVDPTQRLLLDPEGRGPQGGGSGHGHGQGRGQGQESEESVNPWEREDSFEMAPAAPPATGLPARVLRALTMAATVASNWIPFLLPEPPGPPEEPPLSSRQPPSETPRVVLFEDGED